MTRIRLPLIAVSITILLGLVWLTLPGEAGSNQSGVVRIVASAPPPGAIARPTARSETLRLPIAANDENVMLADEQSYRLAHEARDRAWADQSEAAIGWLMRGIPYVGGQRRLEIKCAATVCEVSGIADADPATGSLRPVWQALERDTAGDELGKFGLQRAAAIFDTGRSPDEFRIQYRRIDRITTSERTRSNRALTQG
jgi:hypothetical protein